MSAHPLSHLAPIRHKFCHRPPPLKDKKSALSNGQEPVPMHDTEIIRGWKGVSEKEPLAREGMLPAVVRGWPRAYLVPPRRNIYRSTAEEYGYVSDDFESHLTGRSPLPHGCVDFHTLKATYEEDSDSCWILLILCGPDRWCFSSYFLCGSGRLCFLPTYGVAIAAGLSTFLAAWLLSLGFRHNHYVAVAAGLLVHVICGSGHQFFVFRTHRMANAVVRQNFFL